VNNAMDQILALEKTLLIGDGKKTNAKTASVSGIDGRVKAILALNSTAFKTKPKK
jgi:hypothetical protein